MINVIIDATPKMYANPFVMRLIYEGFLKDMYLQNMHNGWSPISVSIETKDSCEIATGKPIDTKRYGYSKTLQKNIINILLNHFVSNKEFAGNILLQL